MTTTHESTLARLTESVRPRIIHRPGCLRCLGDEARRLGAGRALIVTDPHIVAAGHVDRARRLLDEAGLTTSVFDAVHENPTSDDAAACAQSARQCGADLFIGLGGGSSLDCAKGGNFVLTNGGTMADYRGHNKASQPMLPMIAIPTTAGTGSECQSYALISDPTTHEKMACGDEKAMAAVAILDAELTLTQPRHVTGQTGIDTLAHALESAVTGKRNRESARYARAAFALTMHALPRVLHDGGDVEARQRMQLAAAMAGMAIERSMLGAAHSAANPLTARFEVIHGQAVGLMLPHVIAFNAEDPDAASTYERLAHGIGEPDIAGLIRRVASLLDQAGIVASLGECGAGEGDIPVLAADAATQWTAQFNPRPVDVEAFEAIYRRALTGRDRWRQACRSGRGGLRAGIGEDRARGA